MSLVSSKLPLTAPAPTASNGPVVERRSGLSRKEFIREYRDPKTPVILTDAIKTWPAFSKFTFDFFKNQVGDREVIIGNKKHKLGEFIDLLLQSTPDNPAPYPCKLNMREEFADLAAEAPRYDLANPDRTHSRFLMRRFLDGLYDLEVFIGGPGGAFPYLHYDYLGLFAYINQICGEKEFTIYRPEDEPYLYVDPEMGWTSTVKNHHQPDLEKYPLLAKTSPSKIVLRPGETLFIPSGWWHTARSLTPSISVAFDQLCSSNWQFFKRDCCRLRRSRPLKMALAWTTLTAVGMLLGVHEWFHGNR
jgi:hypothetical protein